MKSITLHRYAGIYIGTFVGLHLFNHLMGLASPEEHIAVMDQFRKIYRHPMIEVSLLLAIIFQLASGLRFFWQSRKQSLGQWFQIQRWSGLYLAFFFANHLVAVAVGRYVMELDTNIYFGASGLNTFPYLLFFIPYYGLAIMSFFAHFAAIHARKMREDIFRLSPSKQAMIILLTGFSLAFLILYGMTHGFQGLAIPSNYQLLSLSKQ